jgi:hypothetical protein
MSRNLCNHVGISRDLVSAIDPLVYPMGACEPLLPPLGPSGLEYPSESDIVVM